MEKRLLLKLMFDGTDFGGWQSQAHANTVQDLLEKAIQEMTGEEHRLYGCSRTDAGVHAREYVAHFDTASRIPVSGWVGGLNALIPPAIAVLDVREAAPDFHARRDAKRKTYRYLIFNRRRRDPFRLDRAWNVFETLDVGAMEAAAKEFEGERDFSAFQAADAETRNPVRLVESCRVTSRSVEGDGREIAIEITAPGFLKYMVRNIVGTLVEIGRGKREVVGLPQVFASRDRSQAGETAPACGLYLIKVEY